MTKEILIVDNEPGVVVPIQFLMEQQGYNIMTANRGEDALDLIYHYKPELVAKVKELLETTYEEAG